VVVADEHGDAGRHHQQADDQRHSDKRWASGPLDKRTLAE
jgi:hypothetical protein